MDAVKFEGAGVSLAGDAAGPEDGVPVLFLHGGGQTRHSWGASVEKAAARGYRGIAIDLRGHGDSGWSADGIYDIDRFADDVGCVVNTLARPAVLVGASLGGMASLLAAASLQHHVAALVLVDVAVRLEADGTREIGDFMSSGVHGFASVEEAADAVATYLPHRARPRDTSGLQRNLRLQADGRYYWHWDPAFIRLGSRTSKSGPALLETAARSLAIPTLLVRGGRSRVLSREGAQAMLDLVPHAELVTVAEADHMVAGDANDTFNEAVFRYLALHAPPRPAAGG